jgi:site-specific recombinase XerD
MKISEFIESLSTQTQSKNTLRAYRQDLERFAAFLRGKGLRVSQVKPSTITEYLSYLGEHRGRTAGDTLSPATTCRRLAVISRYYEWINDNSDEPIRNPVARVRRPKVRNQLPRAVDDSVLATLVNGIPDARDKALVLLFVYSGLRLSELQQLNKDTIALRRRRMPDGSSEYYGTGEVVGKGGKRRRFMAGPKAMEVLAQYIAANRTEDDLPPLFLSSRKGRLSCRAIQQIAGKWCSRLGIDHIHIHQLRHSFATRNVNAGMSSIVLRELMGHESLTTTQRYFHIRKERLAREYHAAMEFVRQTNSV